MMSATSHRPQCGNLGDQLVTLVLLSLANRVVPKESILVTAVEFVELIRTADPSGKPLAEPENPEGVSVALALPDAVG